MHMLRPLPSVLVLFLGLALPAPASAEGCPDPATALGVSRVIEIDASGGPIFGSMTHREKEPSFLAPREVVLTFDDGPVPRNTMPILDTLDKFCTKATFFNVGEMALDYPGTVKEVLARGHTLGTHTWSHPLNLRRLPVEKAIDQIERGFAAVALAAGEPIAPFFRFPGLSDSDELLSHLQTRGIAAFTVDVVSNDSYIGNPDRIAARTLELAEKKQGGILLFHDLKSATAKALPKILTELKAHGFKVVHLKSKLPFSPIPTYEAELTPLLAKRPPAEAKTALVPFYAVPITADGSEMPVTELAPVARARVLTATAAPSAPVTEPVAEPAKPHASTHKARAQRARRNRRRAADAGW